MNTKMQSDAKTPAMPQEVSMEELEKLTKPGAAEDAFKAAADQSTTAVPTLGTAAGLGGTLAFEMPAGAITKGESFTVGAALDLKAQDRNEAIAVAHAKEFGGNQTSAPKGALEEVTELRMEMEAKFNHLLAQVNELKTQHSGPKLDGDVMLAKIRGTVYCPECECQLDGGSNTAQVNMPYTHPMGSAAPKPCSLVGKRFEKPSVYLKVLPAAPYRKPIPA